MFFYLFSFFIILSALGVVLLKNPVHSVLCLIFSFINCAGLFILLGAEFLAMMIVIVYVGAVAVLFLFVIMMIDIDYESARSETPLGIAALGAISCICLVLAISRLIKQSLSGKTFALTQQSSLSNTELIGQVLYSDFLVPFQIAGIVLLVAIVGAIVLTERKKNIIKKQDPAKQLQRSKANTLTLVDIENNSQVKGINYDV